MKRILGCLLLAASFGASAWEVNVCVADNRNQNNKQFHNLATTRTLLICEVGETNKRYTLPMLYEENWQLVKVIDGTMVNNQYRAPVYYLEREKAPKKKRKF